MLERLPPVEFLRECFKYDASTGAMTWRRRPRGHFPNSHEFSRWNTRYAGRPALASVDSHGYLCGSVRVDGVRTALLAARVIYKMETGDEPEIVDHKNGLRADNRFCNLRAASAAENSRNREGWSKKTLSKGVFVENSKFLAQANAGGKTVRLGLFDTPDAAREAYCSWARRNHGAFFNPGQRSAT